MTEEFKAKTNTRLQNLTTSEQQLSEHIQRLQDQIAAGEARIVRFRKESVEPFEVQLEAARLQLAGVQSNLDLLQKLQAEWETEPPPAALPATPDDLKKKRRNT